MSTIATPAPVTAPVSVPASTYRPSESRSFGRLLQVEFRKLIDTRAGLWVLITMGVLAVALTVAGAFMLSYMARDGGPMAGSPVELKTVATNGAGIMATFIAVLGILTVTGEWGQRTTLSTFALEPRRGRVLLAKVIVVVAVSTVLWALSYPLAAGAMAIAHAVFHTHMVYSLSAAAVFGSFLAMLLGGCAMGLAFGLLMLNSPAAIVTYLVLPMVLNLLNLVQMAWKPMKDIMKWVNPSNAQTPFMANWHLADFGPLATTSLIWIVLPAAIGTWRWMRRECK